MLEIRDRSFHYVSSLKELRKQTKVYRVNRREVNSPPDPFCVRNFRPSDIKSEENYVDLIVGEKEAEKVFQNYVRQIKESGAISDIIVGADDHQVYLWNVFREDFSCQTAPDKRYARLNRINYRLARSFSRLAGDIHLAYLNPSNLPKHLEICRARNINLAMISL